MKQMSLNKLGGLLLALLCLQVSFSASAERIKDLASIQGVRSNQLMGYGLVVGLDGTGDKDTDSPYTLNSLKNMLAQFGVQIPPGTKIKPKNAAAVIVHGELPPFSKPGQRIDITVSSLGNAKSLRGGTLLMTPLKGADGKNYALAQGNLVVGGLERGGTGWLKTDGQYTQCRTHTQRCVGRARSAEPIQPGTSGDLESA